MSRRSVVGCLGAFFPVGAGTLLVSDEPHPATLDLNQFRLTFNEDFNTLDVSIGGPGTRWTAHTPWAGDFGDARFANPEKGFPFTISNGILRIECRKDKNGQWESGLLSSVDPAGNGFAQQYGYFEMRAKLPEGPGLWPAFWLDYSAPLDHQTPRDRPDHSFEVDVMEHYGHSPGTYNSTVTVWARPPQTENQAEQHIQQVPEYSLYREFHNYGVSIDKDWIVMYFDRAETWRVKTPPEHKHKLMILLNLGLGSGWPIDKAPSPSFMYVDYVRAYAWRSSSKA
jgi:beta-glucanase (GH16 family)